MIYCDELKPIKFERVELAGVQAPKNMVSVYIFHLKYYRASDMKLYEKDEVFFVQVQKVFTHADFRKEASYPLIMAEIEKFSLSQKALKQTGPQ